MFYHSIGKPTHAHLSLFIKTYLKFLKIKGVPVLVCRLSDLVKCTV